MRRVVSVAVNVLGACSWAILCALALLERCYPI